MNHTIYFLTFNWFIDAIGDFSIFCIGTVDEGDVCHCCDLAGVHDRASHPQTRTACESV